MLLWRLRWFLKKSTVPVQANPPPLMVVSYWTVATAKSQGAMRRRPLLGRGVSFPRTQQRQIEWESNQ